jgi:hypothetical protein
MVYQVEMEIDLSGLEALKMVGTMKMMAVDEDILEFSTLENRSGNGCVLQLEMVLDVCRFLGLENYW